MRHRFSGLALFLCVAVAPALSSCRGKCAPGDCAGCCDSNGVCQPGNVDTVCGGGGYLCVPCGSNEQCQQGYCMPGPGNCSCVGKHCGPDGCGNSCGNCPTGEICGATRACISVSFDAGTPGDAGAPADGGSDAGQTADGGFEDAGVADAGDGG